MTAQVGGLFVVTGFTQSFLHPALISRHGFAVERGSVSTHDVGGLQSGFGRFHVLALRKLAKKAPAPLRSLRDALAPPRFRAPAELPPVRAARRPSRGGGA